jgi:sugar phosphate isomerase/epimerase
VPDSYLPFFDTTVEDFLRLADDLGCESFSAICTFPTGALDVEQLVEPFAELCRRADGLRVDLEFVAIWGLPDLASAWRVVRDAGAANGGVLFDFWHFFRGASDLATLRCIPDEKIHAVQVCDARQRRSAGRSALQDTTKIGSRWAGAS